MFASIRNVNPFGPSGDFAVPKLSSHGIKTVLRISSLIEFFENSLYNVKRLVGSTQAHVWAATLLLFDVAKYKATVQRNSRARY